MSASSRPAHASAPAHAPITSDPINGASSSSNSGSHSFNPHQSQPQSQSQSQSQSQPQSQSQNAQSPLDWTNFMNFPTPPVVNNNNSNAGSINNNNNPNQNGYRYEPRSSQEDQYQNFAHGIAVSRPSPSAGGFQQSLPQVPTASSSRRQYSQSSNSSLPQYQVPSQHTPPQGHLSPSSSDPNGAHSNRNANANSNNNGKGKSPATQDQSRSNPDNGLTLDPAAFSRDIRFQVPSFLTNQVGGAPAFPPGGEAWSGFSGANLFGQDAGQLTPGSIFSNAFGINNHGDQQYCAEPNRNGVEIMASFNENPPFEAWSDQQKDPNNNLSAMFYVNPNPSPSILAPRNPPSIRQKPMAPPVNTTLNQSRQQQNSQQYNSTPSSGSMPTSALLPQPPAFPSNGANTTYDNVPSMSEPTSRAANTINFASSSSAPYAPPSNTQSLLAGPMPPSLTDGPGLYSTTGFDMVGVLARVAARRDPRTVLGPVDLSCSFLVVDIRRYDSPIVYASPSFSSLTGYDLPQILGRNCRFLQGPDGDIVKGSKRKYTDNTAVAHLKRMLNAGKECQASLINYRRGGVPFINLVTVVPIPWDGTDIVYHVGFQVDLVEQPNAILRNMRDGSYQVNYTVSNPPEKPLRLPARDLGVTGLNPDVMEIMGARVNSLAGSGEEAGKMEWLKMVLDNTDDFVHALSLKGFFQYVSPSVRRVLEYEPEELLNKNVSEFAHPSDIVPLMRELKDSTHAPSDGSTSRHVNLVFRIRRKNSGYVWIESVGRLVVEAGKGRKAVILSGRARSVPTLPWDSVSKYGGLAETEFWGKISFQGLLLHTTSGVQGVLGQPSDDVVGQSFFSLLPGGDNGPPSTALLQADPSSPVAAVSNAIRRVLSGDTRHGAVSIQHKLVHKSGQQVDVITMIYAPRRSVSDLRAGSEESGSTGNESEPSPSGGSSASTVGGGNGIQPINLVIQVKLITLPTANNYQALTNARPVVHPPSANVFEELETTRGTSWQYELHQLRMLNRRLKEDISAARARGAGKGKGKKRKMTAGNNGGAIGGNGNTGVPGAGEYGDIEMPPPSHSRSFSHSHSHSQYGNHQMPVPDQFKAAPRHQLAPGFGLVTPGLSTPFY